MTRTGRLYMISIAAELAGVHPADPALLRAEGSGHARDAPVATTRMYSQADLDRHNLTTS